MSKLAIKGGEPIRDTPFPQWPVFDKREVEALREVVYSRFWGIEGKKVREFEEKFAAYQGAKYGVAVTSGTTALEITLRAANIKAGDEVVMPAYTFSATAAAVLQVNALPVFADIDPSTYTLDPRRVEESITDKTKAIIPVHIGGCPANMDSIIRVANRNNLMTIEDACQSWGAEWKGRRVGAIGNLGAFSFQSSKNITSGEGGIITTNDKELYELCWSYHNCGRTLEGPQYEHELLGFNYRMTEFQAAVLLVQLSRLDEQTKTRNENASYLSKELSKIAGVEPLQQCEEATRHAYHLYIFKYNNEDFNDLPRSRFLEALRAEGIPCSPGYTPLHRHRSMLKLAQDPLLSQLYGKKVDYSTFELPVTKRACNEESIWFYQNMLLGTREDMDDIVDAIAKIKENAEELMS
ncbi:MAG: DegT/DnrJ/EryC1/StrS family aminotransferase [Candidatus Bathyarchaeia archaeon]